MTQPARRPLKVGLLLPIIEGTMAGGSAGWAEILAFSRHAEALGFDSLWAPDHLLFRLGRWEGDQVGTLESWSVLAGLAAVTSRIRLGTYVAAVGFRNPAILAKAAVTVDEMSGGRFVLGVGAGWHQPEYDAFGVPFDHRLGRFEEAFTIIRSLIREGRVDFAGRYHQARDCELRPWSPERARLPLLLGSNGPRTLRIALPHVQAWNSDWTHRPAEIAPLRERVDEACADVGRDPAAVERTAGVVIDLPIREPGKDGRASTRGATAPGVDASKPMTGSHAEIAAMLRAYAAEGIGEVMCWIDPADRSGLDWFAGVLEDLDAG